MLNLNHPKPIGAKINHQPIILISWIHPAYTMNRTITRNVYVNIKKKTEGPRPELTLVDSKVLSDCESLTTTR